MLSQLGQVTLRVLERSEWRPVLSINSVVFALQLLFVEPNPLPEHTANFIAASTLQNNAAEFADQVCVKSHNAHYKWK
jgi:ubiquitin-conjugating enzyme E2 M